MPYDFFGGQTMMWSSNQRPGTLAAPRTIRVRSRSAGVGRTSAQCRILGKSRRGFYLVVGLREGLGRLHLGWVGLPTALTHRIVSSIVPQISWDK
jgi:hypothetical protein